MKTSITIDWKPFSHSIKLFYESRLLCTIMVQTEIGDAKRLLLCIAFNEPYKGTWGVFGETVEIMHVNPIVKVSSWNVAIACSKMADIATIFERLLSKLELIYDMQVYLCNQLMTIANYGFAIDENVYFAFKPQVADIFDLSSKAAPVPDDYA